MKPRPPFAFLKVSYNVYACVCVDDFLYAVHNSIIMMLIRLDVTCVTTSVRKVIAFRGRAQLSPRIQTNQVAKSSPSCPASFASAHAFSCPLPIRTSTLSMLTAARKRIKLIKILTRAHSDRVPVREVADHALQSGRARAREAERSAARFVLNARADAATPTRVPHRARAVRAVRFVHIFALGQTAHAAQPVAGGQSARRRRQKDACAQRGRQQHRTTPG